ncbi:VTT domain-containing protein [Candidatus Pelagibacter sp.]|jgi:uncharacterized membrane protein YdjX (TVP38/TMEM64 family)|nr:VTT domain-containing protein [Candidatus Pelagibacter sp.]
MTKSKKIKLIIGILYLICLVSFLYLIFSRFSFDEIKSYDFIKSNRDYIFELKVSNIFLVSVLFILFTILWVLAAGFVSPLALLAGFIFGKWLGLIYLTLGMSIGSTALYLLANFFFKEIIKNKFLYKYKALKQKFQKSEFLYLLIYRFVGGIPFALSNILPCIFNVKAINFFLATFLGIIPQLFVMVTLGSNIEKIIQENISPPSFLDMMLSPDIYFPIIGFIILVFISYMLRKKIFKK